MKLKPDWKFTHSLFTGDKKLLTFLINISSDDFYMRIM